MKVKVCGITNVEDALLCERCGADLIGFVFYKGSKRFISFDNAKTIIRKLSPFTMKVGVFVNEDVKTINKAAEKLKLDFVQLHGDEKPEIVKQINRKVIKAFRINKSFDFESIKQYKKAVPLFDSFSVKEFGGTGKMFNWDFIPKSIRKKIILAGGVSSENVEQIYREINPMAIDVSSSLESSPGRKDFKKVKEFFLIIDQIRSSKWL